MNLKSFWGTWIPIRRIHKIRKCIVMLAQGGFYSLISVRMPFLHLYRAEEAVKYPG
jgi:hypothetical protein